MRGAIPAGIGLTVRRALGAGAKLFGGFLGAADRMRPALLGLDHALLGDLADARRVVRHHLAGVVTVQPQEFDRMMETSPAIPEQVTALFESTFTEGEKLEDLAEEELSARQKSFLALKKPEICDELSRLREFCD